MTASKAMDAQDELVAGASPGMGLALVRFTIGAMFSRARGMEGGHGPGGRARPITAPGQAVLEISLGILLLLGLLTRPVALVACAFLANLWVSEWGTAWIWELLVPVLASLALAVGRAGGTWGIDALLTVRQRYSLWW